MYTLIFINKLNNYCVYCMQKVGFRTVLCGLLIILYGENRGLYYFRPYPIKGVRIQGSGVRQL